MTLTSAGPFNPQSPLVLPKSGLATSDQAAWLLRVSAQLAQLTAAIASGIGANFLPLASQPALGTGDAGYVLWVTDYAHLVSWDGAAWAWMDGARPGQIGHFVADPGAGWGLCDGSTYPLLVVGGATLTTSNLTTPNLAGSPAYLKSGAAYTGAIVAAGGSTATAAQAVGFTNLGADGFGFTGTSHSHTVGTLDMPHVVGLPYVRQ